MPEQHELEAGFGEKNIHPDEYILKNMQMLDPEPPKPQGNEGSGQTQDVPDSRQELQNIDIYDKFISEENLEDTSSPVQEVVQDEEQRSVIKRVASQASGKALERLFKLATSIEAEAPTKPMWENRKTLFPEKKYNPITWIKDHYGERDDEGRWYASGLTMADLSRSDRKLYDAYFARIRRRPEDDLHLPKIEKPRITDAEANVEKRRAKRRDIYTLTKK